MLFQKAITIQPFKQWLLKEKENKRLLWFSLAIMLTSFTWLKIMYPYPNFMPPDSYSYLEAAFKNDFINQWPIGYSRFLRLVSSFSSSHTILTGLQYLLLQISIIYFSFTIRYLLSPSLWTFRILLTASIGCPLLPHIANFVSSDSLFTTLSLAWLTQLLWIIYKPTFQILISHAIILLLAFMVRYNAMYYPIITICIITFSQTRNKNKWYSIGTIVTLLFLFIGRTQHEYFKKTYTIQFSAFGGWQIAANALYGYAYAKSSSPNDLPIQFRPLHTIVNKHMDSLRHIPIRPDEEPGVYYFWDFKSPLVIYMNKLYQNKNHITYFNQWASMAPQYASYGRYLIKKNPGSFLKHFVWPNFLRYYAPPTLFMGLYNMGNKTVDPIVTTWFDWKDNKLFMRAKSSIISITSFFTIFNAIVNMAFVASFLAFVSLGGYLQSNQENKKTLWLILTIWLCNMIFSVFTAPIELRYQIFPYILTFTWDVIFISYIIQEIKNNTKTEKMQRQSISTEIAV